ncbi:MAG: flagellar basal body rod C-terminal domain-containing protein [Burkholderiaceae bacterium]
MNIGTDNVVGGDTPSGAFGSMISTIGGRAFTAANDLQQSTTWQQSAVSARDSVSGVNLDEEAARLIQYQQAYQAAAKVIATSQDMFDTLMSVTR